MIRNEILKEEGIFELKQIFEDLDPKSIFLVTGKTSFTLSGAEAKIKDLLKGKETVKFSDFSVNPKIEDVEKGIMALKSKNFELIIAIGGGTAIDIAKLINIFQAQKSKPIEIINKHSNIATRGLPLVAIPTTAGTGSEVTHFAVVYVNKEKYSVAHRFILPDYAIVDPLLTHSMSAYVTACSGLDALCQAIESYWSVNSNEESRNYSKKAISLAWAHLKKSVLNPSAISRTKMALASNLAGKAINITKTTAPHSFSYSLTSYFGLSHGHAVALFMPFFIKYNLEVTLQNINDKRGLDYVTKINFNLLKILGCSSADRASEKFKLLLSDLNLAHDFATLGWINHDNAEIIVENVNYERLRNNPVLVQKEDVKRMLYEQISSNPEREFRRRYY